MNLEQTKHSLDKAESFILRPYFAEEIIRNMDSISHVFGNDFASMIANKARADVEKGGVEYV